MRGGGGCPHAPRSSRCPPRGGGAGRWCHGRLKCIDGTVWRGAARVVRSPRPPGGSASAVASPGGARVESGSRDEGCGYVPGPLDLRNGPQIRQGYPLSLSISLSGGKETNEDFPSSGERTGKSPA